MKREDVIILLAVLGILLSGYSTLTHYSKDASAFCDINQKFSCDIVNKSIYSELYGVPVAILGIIGYALLLGLTLLFKKKKEKNLKMLLITTSGLAVLFSIYLTYIEAFVLYTYCVVCLTSAIVILSIFVISVSLNLKK